MAHNILLAGLGRIGATYDIEHKDGHEPRSHLGAIRSHPAFNISHLVDPDETSFKAIQKQWGLNSGIYVKTLADVSGVVDVCVFATPPDDRIEELKFALDRKAKVIVFEKPSSRNYAEAKKMLDMWQSSPEKPNILVNFTRRFDKKYQSLKGALENKPDRIVCFYSKGLENYASHHIDLVQDWFGNIASLQAFGNLGAENPSFSCRTEQGLQVDFLGMAECDYDIFDMQLWFKDKRIDVVNGGTEIREYLPQRDLYYKNYAHLAEQKNARPYGAISGMTGLYKRVDELLTVGKNCDAGDALKSAVQVMKAIEAVKLSAQSNGKIIKLEDV